MHVCVHVCVCVCKFVTVCLPAYVWDGGVSDC